ncbi:unnamed protein product [Somion occarium]
MSATLSLYEILGLERTATTDDIRKAYKKRALETHPDRLPQGATTEEKASAEEQFRLVNNAYEVLNDPRNRELYDRSGAWPPPSAPEEPRANYRSRSRAEPFDPFMGDPFFSSAFGSRGPFAFSDPFELFNSIFGDMNRHFDDDPYFNDAFPSMRSPFGAFGGSMMRDPFGGSMLTPFTPGFPFGRSLLDDMQGGQGRRVYSSTSSGGGANGQWVSQNRMTRTINGRTETIIKRRDAQGNEHITYSSPESERYTINGVEQPVAGQMQNHQPRRPVTNAPPLPQVAYNAYNQPASFAVPITEQVPVTPPSRSAPAPAPYPQQQQYTSNRASYVPLVNPAPSRSSHSRHSTQANVTNPPPYAQDAYTSKRSSRRDSGDHHSHHSSHHRHDSAGSSYSRNRHPEDREHPSRRHTHDDTGADPGSGSKKWWQGGW